MPLPKPECVGGYPFNQVVEILRENNRDLTEFDHWMRGQTRMLCEGRRYNHETKEYQTECGGVAHGGIVYPWDMERFLQRKPVID